MAIQHDGRIVAAGMSNFGWLCAFDFVLARYTNDQSVALALRFESGSIRQGIPFRATFVGPDLNNETYFDLRFRSPTDENDRVVLNWQRGISAVHETVGINSGTWTVVRVRPHQRMDDHTGDFVPVSATLTVLE